MKIKNYQKGFGVFGTLLAIVVTCTVIGGSLYVYNSIRVKKSNNKLSTSDFKPDNYAECVRAGGEIKYIDIPPNPGFKQSDTDTSFGTTHCDYPLTPALFPEVDITCKDEQKCTDILLAARGTCNELNPGKDFNPTFKYRPAANENFARLYLSDCSSSHLKNDIVATLILKKTNGNWLIFKKFISSVPCTEVDGAGIPLEFIVRCEDPMAGFRVPK